jgi:hypothetical protein
LRSPVTRTAPDDDGADIAVTPFPEACAISARS